MSDTDDIEDLTETDFFERAAPVDPIAFAAARLRAAERALARVAGPDAAKLREPLAQVRSAIATLEQG
ncbi:MAG: hypothetical protein AAGI51_15975 [Pseudomonadota bacterium]